MLGARGNAPHHSSPLRGYWCQEMPRHARVQLARARAVVSWNSRGRHSLEKVCKVCVGTRKSEGYQLAKRLCDTSHSARGQETHAIAGKVDDESAPKPSQVLSSTNGPCCHAVLHRYRSNHRIRQLTRGALRAWLLPGSTISTRRYVVPESLGTTHPERNLLLKLLSKVHLPKPKRRCSVSLDVCPDWVLHTLGISHVVSRPSLRHSIHTTSDCYSKLRVRLHASMDMKAFCSRFL